MLQKGIIETIEDKYTAKVRVPKYDKLESSATGTKKEDLAVGIICTFPGMNITYAVGDIVLVDFENDELSKPVILGLLYRDHESNAILEVTNIDNSLSTINEQLSLLTDKRLYTHVKYSNDNGNTFTSLFDILKCRENKDFSVSFTEPISISNDTRFIYWNIIDDNNVNVTDNFIISTTIHGINTLKDIDETFTFTDRSIEVPLIIQACTDVTLDFELQIPPDEISKYYITLTTDISAIGDIYGDYTGIAVSDSPNAPDSPSMYNWSSNKERNEIYISQFADNIIPRLERNELDIRGYVEDNYTESTGLGLTENIIIGDNSVLLNPNTANTYFGSTDNYIDQYESSLHINSIAQGNFEFVQSNNHLYLFYDEDN